MQKSSRIAVVGATGRVGRHVARVLEERDHQVVPISRSSGVDVVTGDGLAEALNGVEVIIDVSSTPSPEQAAATEFFTTTALTCTRPDTRTASAGWWWCRSSASTAPPPATTRPNWPTRKQHWPARSPRIVRAAQFHEFVEQLVGWGTQGDVAYVPNMRTQLVAARTVAEKLVEVATDADPVPTGAPYPEIAGPRAENLADAARLLAARQGSPSRIEEVSDPANPDRDLFENGGLLPGPHATLAGPTYADWLDQPTP